MDELAELLERAHHAGLFLSLTQGGRLKVNGPQSAEPIARELLAREDDILPILHPGVDDLLTAARALGWPSVRFGRVTISATEQAWTAVTNRLDAKGRLDAFATLETLEEAWRVESVSS